MGPVSPPYWNRYKALALSYEVSRSETDTDTAVFE
jgi:hypothetical protein